MPDPAKVAPPSKNPIVNSLLLGGSWSGTQVTYGFMAGDMDRNGIKDFDEGDWKAFYREILDNVESFANLTFSQVSVRANINFRLEPGAGGASNIPVNGTSEVETVVGINPDVAGSAAAVRLGTFSETWFHEIGHALGLKHTHDEIEEVFLKLPGVIDPADKGAAYLNSQLYTVMPYTFSFLGEDNPFTAAVDFATPVNAQPGSFGAIDIAALQHLYGAKAHNTGNDTYRFGDNVDANRGYTTIWDTGGTDTIEYIGTGRAKIDLRAATLRAEVGGGGWVSTSETLTGGYTIANGVVVENASGNGADDILIGNAAGNTLAGRGGNDRLDGLAGDDRLDGGAGDDRLDGGDGTDSALYQRAFATYSIRSEGETTVITGEGVDRLVNIEKAVFADGVYDLARRVFEPNVKVPATTLNGTDGAETLVAKDASGWTLNGAAGDDVLVGNGGIDRLDGGLGNDRLDGRGGTDRMVGRSGNDTYVVDNPGDIVWEGADSGRDTVESSISYMLGDNVETLVLTGTEALSGTGNTLDNTLFGNGADNVLTGGGGNDWLDGRGGADRLIGGSGDDYYIVDDARDTVEEGVSEGTDHVESTVSFRLWSNLENLYLVGRDTISAMGNERDNTVVGNDVANTLWGLAGRDILNGYGGNDRLIGGAGQDVLTGGLGRDVFVFRTGDTGASLATADTIRDFAQGDRIDLTGFGSGSTAPLAFAGSGALAGSAGEVRYLQAGGQTLLQGDLDGDRKADFVVVLNGLHSLTRDDLLV